METLAAGIQGSNSCLVMEVQAGWCPDKIQYEKINPVNFVFAGNLLVARDH